MKKRLPRKSIFLIVFMSIVIVFAAVMLIIDALPDPLPEYKAVDDVVETNEDTAVTVKVLENDIDEDKESLEITDFTQPAHGRVAKTTTGIRYIPNVNFNGTDTFTYTISNANNVTTTGNVTVTVKAVNDTPRANLDQVSTVQDVSLLIDVLLNDTDVDGDTLTIKSLMSLPSHGTVTIEDGKVRYVPESGYTGTDSFTYLCVDTAGATSSANVSIIVTAPQE